MIPINQLSASMIQTIANRLLSLDAESNNQLKPFESKIIHIEISDLNLQYFFTFVNGQLKVTNSCEQEASASIRGELKAFLAAAASEHSSDSIFKGELMFSGEINTAKQFQSFVQSMQIDWHEPLAKVLGDPIGHTFAVGLEKFSGWLKTAVRSTRSDISEYLQEEARVTPTFCEQQAFFGKVDQLRSRSDRLNARINNLQSRIRETSATGAYTKP